MTPIKSFEQVILDNTTIPECQLSAKTKFKWALSFTKDFILRKNQRYRKDQRLNESLLKEFTFKNNTEYFEPISLPEVATIDIPAKSFSRWRKKVNMPIVLRGYIKNSDACRHWSKSWLTANYGNKKVQCIPPDIPSLIGEEVKLETVTISDFCNSDKYHNYYINNHHLLFKKKDFYESCNGKKIEALRGSRHLIDQWFISRSNQTGTSLHCANGDNIFLNIKGRKEWHFIHPSFTPLLSPILSKYGVYAVAGVEKSLLSKWDAIKEIYPYFIFIPVYKVVLEEGDVLFNPPWWWHSVRNLENFTVGCATRYLAPGKASNVPVFHFGQMIEAIRHPIKSIYPQTLRMLFFKGVNSGLINSIFSKK